MEEGRLEHPAGSRFDGKVAVVTGAAGGLGAASARRLAREGASIVAVDIDGDRLNRLTESLPSPSLPVVGDVSDEAGVDRYMAAALDRFGSVDLHHLNAGIPGPPAALPDLTAADFDRVVAVDMRGVFLGLRAAFRDARARGTRPAIVVTASIASLRGSADLFAYHAAKHGVAGMVKAAALYGGPLGIRVNGVAPGIIPTDLFAASAGAVSGREDMVRRASTTPLRREGTSDEVAGVVAFLFSEDAAYMTATLVSVDGGAAAVSAVRPSGGAGAWDTGALDSRLYGDATI